jgi:hypothetical protein
VWYSIAHMLPSFTALDVGGNSASYVPHMLRQVSKDVLHAVNQEEVGGYHNAVDEDEDETTNFEDLLFSSPDGPRDVIYSHLVDPHPLVIWSRIKIGPPDYVDINTPAEMTGYWDRGRFGNMAPQLKKGNWDDATYRHTRRLRYVFKFEEITIAFPECVNMADENELIQRLTANRLWVAARGWNIDNKRQLWLRERRIELDTLAAEQTWRIEGTRDMSASRPRTRRLIPLGPIVVQGYTPEQARADAIAKYMEELDRTISPWMMNRFKTTARSQWQQDWFRADGVTIKWVAQTTLQKLHCVSRAVHDAIAAVEAP